MASTWIGLDRGYNNGTNFLKSRLIRLIVGAIEFFVMTYKKQRQLVTKIGSVPHQFELAIIDVTHTFSPSFTFSLSLSLSLSLPPSPSL